jgi:hypothetical protein
MSKLALLTMTFCLAQEPQQPKLVLSELENARLEGFKLRRELIQTQFRLAMTQYADDLGRFVQETMKAHGNPAGVKFDAQGLAFQVEPRQEKR